VTKIKICGNTRGADVELAVELGADLLGFIFTRSKRQVRVGEQCRRQHARDRRLLDDLDAPDLGRQRLQPAAVNPRLLQQIAQIEAAALDPVVLGEHRIPQGCVDTIGFECGIVLEVDRLGIAALQAVERRLGDVEKPLVDQARHLAEEEGQQ